MFVRPNREMHNLLDIDIDEFLANLVLKPRQNIITIDTDSKELNWISGVLVGHRIGVSPMLRLLPSPLIWRRFNPDTALTVLVKMMCNADLSAREGLSLIVPIPMSFE